MKIHANYRYPWTDLSRISMHRVPQGIISVPTHSKTELNTQNQPAHCGDTGHSTAIFVTVEVHFFSEVIKLHLNNMATCQIRGYIYEWNLFQDMDKSTNFFITIIEKLWLGEWLLSGNNKFIHLLERSSSWYKEKGCSPHLAIDFLKPCPDSLKIKISKKSI